MNRIIIGLTIVMFLNISCQNERSAESILQETKEKITGNNLTSYQYVSVWDSKFNDDVHIDSVYIEREFSSENIHGFRYNTSRDFFDGTISKDIDHEGRRIINYDPIDIANDNAYFQNKMNFVGEPIQFLDIDSTYIVKDSTMQGKPVLIFSTRTEFPSDSKKLSQIHNYIINKDSTKPWMIEKISLTNNDTTQIITSTFHDLEFSNESIDFAKIRSTVLELGYPEIDEDQVTDEMYDKQIKKGSKLSNSTFTNIYDEETVISGKGNRRSVVMFSFMGCGGCEYALKEMKKKDFDFRDDVDFFYSSHRDKSLVLKEYLPKKGLDAIGFGKESAMNDDFNAFIFPTFFIVDSSGTVTDIFQGYSEVFEAAIFLD